MTEQLANVSTPENLAQKLLAENLISQNAYNYATNYGPGVNKQDRTRKIIEEVLSKVKENSDNFYEFLRVLEDSSEALQDVVELIKTTEL